MAEIALSAVERGLGTLSPTNLSDARAALDQDGYVILNDVVDPGHIAVLREKMLSDAEVIMAQPNPPYQFTRGHIQHDPPPVPPYLFRDILVNDFVVTLTRGALGRGLQNTFYSGNTNMPGSGFQPVHPDTAQLWRNLERAHPPYAYVVNVPIVDMDESNGSTELWPGTQKDTSMWEGMGTLRVPEPSLTVWRAKRPPIQPAVRAGSIVIRDIRLWHRGVPNYSDRPRPMIAMIHRINWWNSCGKMKFPSGTESLFENSPLTTNAIFVDEPIDYLDSNRPYDFPG